MYFILKISNFAKESLRSEHLLLAVLAVTPLNCRASFVFPVLTGCANFFQFPFYVLDMGDLHMSQNGFLTFATAET